nr:reverse transcriptase domain-containing protein [Tanacetum cinerariifolium]
MHTRNSYFPNNSSVTIMRRQNKRRAPNVVEPKLRTIVEIAPMADNRTMEELLQAPTEGYGKAIVIPEINADHFETKTNLLQLVQVNPYHGFERENPHTHINNFKRITSTLKLKDVPNDVIKLRMFPYSLDGAARVWYEKEPPNSILTWDDLVNKFVNQFFLPSKTTHLKNEISRFTQRFEETFGEAWEQFKERLRACPHHGFTELTGDDGDVMFIEIVKKNDDSCKEETKVGENVGMGESEVEYFDIFPTRSEFLVIHQPIHEKMRAELLAEEHAANINTQQFQYSVVPQPPQEEISVEFLQEKINQINSMQTFLRKFNRISFYEMPKVLSLAWETILEIKHALEDKHCQPEDILELFRRLHNDVQNIHKDLAVYINTLSWDRPTICYNDDDDEDCTIAITPILSTEEPNNSLSIGDEHLDIISKMESDELIKSSVENLVLIPSESEGIPDNMYQFKDFFDSNEDSTSIDDDSFSVDDIEYVEASPPDSELVSLEVMEIVIPKVGGIDEDILLTIKDDILREKLLNIKLLIANIEALKENPTPYSDFMTKSSSTSLNFLLEETNTFDNSLPEYKTFCFDSEENSSGSTTTRSDISLSDYEAFYDDHVKEISIGSTTTHSDFSLYDSFIFDLSINPFPPADRSNIYHEEFTDELAHIISPPKYDCFSFKNEPN